MIKNHIFKNYLLFLLVALLTISCSKIENQNTANPTNTLLQIEVVLDAFVQTLVTTPPTQQDISNRVKQYLLSNPKSFFGSTVALLDSNGKVSYSPYWYRLNDTLAMLNLADTSYHIDEQPWLRLPIDEGKAIWTDPYFDAGGGDIWMRTRSVPVIIDGKIIAVATTDLEVAKP